MVFAIAALTLTGCDDVPMPYNEPSVTPDEPTVVVDPTGSGTADDPYNVAAALLATKSLSGDNTTDQIYVKGRVKEISNIETEQYGNANYYITDDGNNQIYIFQSYYLGNRKFTANDRLVVGDTVVVCGKFYNYVRGNDTIPETVGRGSSYIYSLNGKTEGGDTPTPTPSEAKGDGTQANPYNAAGANAKAATLADGEQLKDVYVSGVISKIGEFNSRYGELNYYISDDGTDSGSQFYVYNGYGKDGAKFSAATDLKVGQKVTVVGTLINFKGNTPEFQYGSKIVSIEGGGDEPSTPDTPSGEALSISGTTVTLTNTSATAGEETATINFADQGLANQADATTFTLTDGTKITFDGNGQRNSPKYYTATKGIRVYLNNIITFNGIKKIAKIVMTCDSYNGTDYVGNKAASVSFNGNDAVYTNSDASVTSGGGVQLRVKTITITYAK